MTEQAGGEFKIEMLYRPSSLDDALIVLNDKDIFEKLNKPDYSKLPMHRCQFYGIYLDNEIIALLIHVNVDHLYVRKKYRHLSDKCLKEFEKHHALTFKPESRLTRWFLFKNGYKQVNSEFVKCPL